MYRDMTRGGITRSLLLFALPMMAGSLLQQLYNVADTLIVGRALGRDALAAVGSAFTLMTFLTSVFLGLAMGAGALFSIYLGRKDMASLHRAAALALCLIGGVTAALTALVYVLLDPILRFLQVPDPLYGDMGGYLRIIFVGLAATFLYNFFACLLRSAGNSAAPLWFLGGAALLNVGLDLLFILKFHWGVAGAAAATVSAQLISTVGCFCYAFAHYPNIRLKKEDWHITMHDVRRHVSRGIPLGLQFSVLAVGIIVMQGGVVQFDMLDGRMVSNAAQNGFGAANKLNSLVMTPMNALGTAMTSFTAQNLGAGRYDRIKKGTLQGMVLMGVIMALAVSIGMLLTIDQLYLHVFLSADKVTEETIRFGNSFLYVDFALYPFLGGIFLFRNCAQGIGQSPFVLGAGAAELLARIAVCSLLPAAVAGGAVSTQAPALAFYALCAADPMAWIAADAVLCVPLIRNILRMNYGYLHSSRM